MSGNRPIDRDEVLDEVREEYARRTQRFDTLDPRGRRMFERLMRRRHRSYQRFMARNGLLPLGDKAILDVGSGRNEWLVECREAWGHTGEVLCGIDLLPERVTQGMAEHAYLKLRAGSADVLPWPDDAFDLVHQGMLLTSVPDEALRERIVAEIRRVTKPGGVVLWYDFVWNPANRAAKAISAHQVRAYFPGWTLVDRERATLAPPIARILLPVWERLADAIERVRFMNFWELALLRKPAATGSGPAI